MRIALAGNPNSGKTTMYNALTGQNEKVGNWAGVTVDKKECPIKKSFYEAEELIVVDLPGAYSMSPFTSEESVTRDYVKNENPDVIINIVDATNLSRGLFFTTQILELGIPVVVALNKNDINRKKETRINVELLSEKLGCPVIKTVSTTNEGLKDVITKAVGLVGSKQTAPYEQGDVDLTDKSSVEKADRARFAFVNDIVKKVEKRKILTSDKNVNDKIDAVLTNPIAGIIIFALVMWAVFWISQVGLGPMIADGLELPDGTLIPGLVPLIEMFGSWVSGLVENTEPILQTILVDGIIGGVGAVVGFLPLVMVMYFLLALLEDCGYMARVSVVLDPIFKKVGLSGKSVIPLVIGTGCAVPGIMACRTIRDERERRATAMLTPFIPCGAKIPLIALFAGAFFPDSHWVSPVMYFVGILMVLLGGLLVKAVTGQRYKKSFFIIELPDYKAPNLWSAVKVMFSRAKAYIVKAGTIILVCNALISIMASYTWTFKEAAEDASDSILQTIAEPFAILLIPLGFGAWQLAAAAITGFIAKEEVVGTLAAVFAVGESVISADFELMEGAAFVEAIGTSGVELTAVAALGYLMFNLYTPPCFAAIGAMNSEIKSRKWFFAGIGLQLAVGYVIAFLVYQIGTPIMHAITGEGPAVGNGLIPGAIAVFILISIIVMLIIRGNIIAKKSLKKNS